MFFLRTVRIMVNDDKAEAGHGKRSRCRSPEEIIPKEVDAGSEAEEMEGFAEDDIAGDLENLYAEMESLNDRHLRLAAEFDNYRKRVERDRAQSRSMAQAEIVKAVLEVLDDLQRIMDQGHADGSATALQEGIALVEKKFRHVLESAGLKPLDVEGECFDPATMEAMMTVPADGPEDDGLVAAVFAKGYLFKDILIRPAKVQVKQYQDCQ